MKSNCKSQGSIVGRVVHSRSGRQSHSLIHCNRRTSSKCKCPAYFTLYENGKVVFKNDHAELCLPDPDIENDDNVSNSSLPPAKKSSIITSVTDMMSDYGNSPVKNGDTGFGSD